MFTTNLYNSRLLFCLVLLFLTACGGNELTSIEVEKPDKLISEEKMVELMIETHILEAKIVDKRMNNDKAVATYNKFEKEIFDQSGLDSTLYYSSYNYYFSDLETFQSLITAVTDTLKERKEREMELELELEAEIKKQ
jgi:ADP-glucose pyrophosphorylase